MNNSAKEMFEELGYRLTSNQTPIQKKFYKKIPQAKQLAEHLIFNIWENGEWEIEHYAIRKNPNTIEHRSISDKLNRAIQKQIEELGWDKEDR